MKKFLVIILLFVVGIVVFAQDFDIDPEESYTVLDEGTVEGAFNYVSIAADSMPIALAFIEGWGGDLNSWVSMDTQEINQILRRAGLDMDVKILLDEELGGKIGVYLYLYIESNIRVSALYSDGCISFTSDNPEVIEAIKENKDIVIQGLLGI